MLHPDYIWHDNAQSWQKSNIGEQAIAGMVANADQDFVDIFSSLSMTPTVAANIKSHLNDDMATATSPSITAPPNQL